MSEMNRLPDAVFEMNRQRPTTFLEQTAGKKRYVVTTTEYGNIEIHHRQKLRAYITVWPDGYFINSDRVKGISGQDGTRTWDTLEELLKHLQRKWRCQANCHGMSECYEIAFDLTKFQKGPCLLRRNYSLVEVQTKDQATVTVPNNGTCQHCEHCPSDPESDDPRCRAFGEALFRVEVGLFQKCRACTNAIRSRGTANYVKAKALQMAKSLQEIEK